MYRKKLPALFRYGELFKSELNFFGKEVSNLIDRYSFLLHCITVTNSYAAIVFGIEIVGDAVRSSYLILAAVTFAD